MFRGSTSENIWIAKTFKDGEGYYNKKPKRDYANALKEFEEVVKHNPNHAEAWWYIGTCLRNISKDNSPRAVECYTKALSIKPGMRDAQMARAGAYCEIGDYAKAVSDCSDILKSNPKDFTALHYRSVAHRMMGNYPQALADARASVTINKDYSASHLALVDKEHKSNLELALNAIKTINDHVWKVIEPAMGKSKQILLSFKLLKSSNNVFLSSAIHIAKEFAAGKSPSEVFAGVIPEIEKSLFKDFAVSEGVKQSAKVLGKLRSKIFGGILGELLFSDSLNKGEFNDPRFKFSINGRINAMDPAKYKSLMEKYFKDSQAKIASVAVAPAPKPEPKAAPKAALKVAPKTAPKVASKPVPKAVAQPIPKISSNKQEEDRRQRDEQEHKRRADAENKRREDERKKQMEADKKRLDEQRKRDADMAKQEQDHARHLRNMMEREKLRKQKEEDDRKKQREKEYRERRDREDRERAKRMSSSSYSSNRSIGGGGGGHYSGGGLFSSSTISSSTSRSGYTSCVPYYKDKNSALCWDKSGTPFRVRR